MSYRFIQSRLFAGVAVVVVAIALIVGAFAFGMYPSSGDEIGEPALGPGRIAFVSERDGDAEIYVMNADGSGVEQLTDNDSTDHSPSWSPDGDRIVFESDRGNDAHRFDLYVMNADGSGVVRLTTEGCSKGSPAWSPDGDRIAFTSESNIYVMNADGSGVEQLTGDPPEICSPLFFADRDGDGHIELYIRREDDSVELFTDWDSFRGWGPTNWHPSWSPDGDRIVFQSASEDNFVGLDIFVMNADGSGVEQLTDDEYLDWVPSWSPDGRRIAFNSLRDGDEWNIYVMNADGSGVVPLTENEYTDIAPSWSPDGGRIAFNSDRESGGGSGIYVMNADGSGIVQLTENEYTDYDAVWSPRLE